jgi:hypothetical protein
MQNPPSTDGLNNWQARKGGVARTPMACRCQMSTGNQTMVTTASRSTANGLMYPTMPLSRSRTGQVVRWYGQRGWMGILKCDASFLGL